MRLFALGLLTLSSAALAKDPCKKVKSHTDAFGTESRGTVAYVGIGGYLAVSVVQSGEKKTLSTMYVMPGQVDTVVTAGTVGEAKLADGTLLSFPTREDAAPVTNANSATVFTQWQLAFDLDDGALKQLAASPIVAVRSTIGAHDVSFEVPAAKGDKLRVTAGCLL